MYSLHSIESLSKPQISRLLNGHGVRVRHGGHHKIHLSHEQSKKHHKASREGKGYTLHFDPYQMAQHQHLRGKGTGTAFGAVLGHVASGAAQAAGTRLTDAIAGTDSNANQDAYDNTAGTTMTAQGVRRTGRPHKVGGAVNRINKYNRWTGVLGDTYHSVADVLKPVAQPIFQAGTARAVGYINPTTPQDYYNNSGMGIKRRGRPHKMHGKGGKSEPVDGGPRYGTPPPAYSKEYSGHGIKRRGRPRMHGGESKNLTQYQHDHPEPLDGSGMRRRGRPRKMHGGYVSKSDQEKYPAPPIWHPPPPGVSAGSEGGGMRRHHKHTGGAMFQSGLMGYGVHHKKKVVHRKKKHALLFDL